MCVLLITWASLNVQRTVQKPTESENNVHFRAKFIFPPHMIVKICKVETMTQALALKHLGTALAITNDNY